MPFRLVVWIRLLSTIANAFVIRLKVFPQWLTFAGVAICPLFHRGQTIMQLPDDQSLEDIQYQLLEMKSIIDDSGIGK